MPADKPALAMRDIASFQAAYAPPDEGVAAALLPAAGRSHEAEARIDARAAHLVQAIRARVGGVEDFLHAYALSTKEGLALMVLAEALLRVPDAGTADRLIEDKLKAGDWAHHDARTAALLVSASAWTLGITARVIHASETPEGIVEALVRRLGLPAVRAATRQAMRLLGSHFVLGQTIEEALARARSHHEYLYSFDMLGEGARTADDAERYFDSYANAIAAIGKTAGNVALPKRPGISVKLSALHPRYEPLSRARVLKELVPKLLELARMAKGHALNFTVDAEEADRLELSLAVIAAVLRDPSLAGWDGFGLAVQAYQKRAAAVIDWIAQAAQALDRRLMVRLVKGAYWDTEIKRAQERGLADYPVFTRKAMTDLCYLDCVRKLLAARPRLYPQFATHNALTVASVIEAAGGTNGYEFQRLHGMGEALYHALIADLPELICRVYAPVYRQITLSALDQPARITLADALIAYNSVLAAFRDYLAHYNHGRGIVFIGHSQGASILIKLLKDQVDAKPAMRHQLVSALLLGGNVTVRKGRSTGGDFDHIPLCGSSMQTGCVVAYSSFTAKPPSNSQFGRTTSDAGVSLLAPHNISPKIAIACVNPAAPAGGQTRLDPYVPSLFLQFLAAGAAPQVGTPWVSFPAEYTASCKSSGNATWLQVTHTSGSLDQRPLLGQLVDPALGLHILDVNIALGNLVQLVRDEAGAYRG